MILNTLFIFIFTYFSINKFRESLDRRYLLVPSPAFLPKCTIITRYCNQLDITHFLLPKTYMCSPTSDLHLFIILSFHSVAYCYRLISRISYEEAAKGA